MGAPTAKLETVVVVSPFKVLSISLAALAALFLVVSIPTSFWLHADNNNRYGIWKQCEIVDNNSESADNNESEHLNNQTITCTVTNRVWVQISGSLILICLACTVIGIGLIIAGFKHSERQERKMKFYQTGGIVFLIAIISMVLALILFPTMLQTELTERGKDKWFFGWSYGLAWGATIFLASAVGLLIYDRNKEEIFYKEKIFQEEDEENMMVNQEAKIKTLN